MRILVVQPYLAQYREPFWTQLVARLSEYGVQCDPAFGAADPTMAARGDQVALTGAVMTPRRQFSIGGPTLRCQYSWRLSGDYDAVVLEASGSLIDTYVALARKKPVGLWGHIATFTNKPSRIDSQLETWQLRRAKHVFAYTQRGTESAIARGVDPRLVTTLNNTFDTTPLLRQVATTSRTEADTLLGTAGWKRSETFCFIGGIDESKRIGFLAEAFEQLWFTRPSLRVLVGGRGDQESLLAPAIKRGQVKMIGRAGSKEKAALAKVATAILMPGRVGLIAVDSLALGLPIVTTSSPFHAPEFDYLTPDVDCLVTVNRLDDYIHGICRLMDDPDLSAQLQAGASAKAGWPPLEEMVSRFANGCLKLFN